MRNTGKSHVHILGLYLLTLVFAIIYLSSASLQANPRKVTRDELDSILAGKLPKKTTKVFLPTGSRIKIPKNSRKEIGRSLFETRVLYQIDINTPRAQAAIFAGCAKDNYVKLDTTNFHPDMFNGFVEIVVWNLMAREEVWRVERCILVIGDNIHEADSVVFDESTMGNLYGAEFTNTDATFYFPLELFAVDDDIKIVIFDNTGKFEKKLKKKDLRKLE